MSDVPLSDAMLCWTSERHGDAPRFAVIRHPDYKGLSDDYNSSVGACFGYWRDLSERDQRLKLMVEAWHIAAFYNVPVDMIHEGMLVIPEYRDMLADDCMPSEFRAERDI